MGVNAESLTIRRGRPPAPPSSALGTRTPAQEPGQVPVRAQGMELLGSFDRSGHREEQYLARRVDGQIVQLTPLLYSVLDAIDGRRTYAGVACVVAERIGKGCAAQDVHFLIENKLRPLGVLRETDGAEPVTKRANPLLALRFRAVVGNERVTGAIASVFAPLFRIPFVVAFTLAFVAVMGWLLFSHGLAPAARQAIYEPELLLVVFALTTLSAGFHELGHAAGCRFSGGKPGAMGVGLYLVWPAFYTDVTDAYRLERKGRLRTDLGGIYFNAIFGVAAYGLWRLTDIQALLIVIPLQGLLMLRQLIPMVRLDGYHILADLTGVPDLFAHIKPILKGMLPTRWGKGDAKYLKPWVRAVVTAWVAVVVPVLLGVLALMVWTLPRLLATAWDSAYMSARAFNAQLADGEIAGAALSVLAILALAIPSLSMVYLVFRIAQRSSTRLWRATHSRPVRRLGLVLVALALIGALAAAWWPRDGRYTPIDSTDRGVVADLMMLDPGDTRLTTALAGADLTSLTLASAEADALPVGYQLVDQADIEELVVIVQGSFDERTRFPFPLPDPPGMGDNQALVVNTVDGSELIDIAISLVFVDADEVVNQNGAYAYASCSKCTTVAIAFQVVVILDGAQVIAPENLAAAINAECARCITHALATQLIGTTLDPLTPEEMSKLRRLWGQLKRLDGRAHKMALAEVFAEFDRIQTAIEDLLLNEISDTPMENDTATDGTATEGAITEDEAMVAPSTSPSTDPTPTTSPSSSPSSSPSATASPSPSSNP